METAIPHQTCKNGRKAHICNYLLCCFFHDQAAEMSTHSLISQSENVVTEKDSGYYNHLSIQVFMMIIAIL